MSGKHARVKPGAVLTLGIALVLFALALFAFGGNSHDPNLGNNPNQPSSQTTGRVRPPGDSMPSMRERTCPMRSLRPGCRRDDARRSRPGCPGR